MHIPSINNPKPKEVEDILITFSLSILEQKTEDEVIWNIVENCISALDFEDCVIYFIDEEKQRLEQRAAFGPKSSLSHKIVSPITIPLGEGITGHVAQSGEALLISNTANDPRYLIDDKKRCSELAVPIKLDHRIIGVIDCEHSKENFFTRQHLRILSAISSICGIKLSQLRSEQMARRQQIQTDKIQHQLAKLRTKILMAQMNPHFVFNALNSTQYFLTSKDQTQALQYLGIFSKVIRYYLGHFEKDQVPFAKEQEALKQYLNLQKLRYEDKFTYELNIINGEKNNSFLFPPLLSMSILETIVEECVSDHHELHVIIDFTFNDKYLKLQIMYRSAKPKLASSDYRNGLISWEDHVDQLNKLKGYKIKRAINHMDQLDMKDSNIQLIIPNSHA